MIIRIIQNIVPQPELTVSKKLSPLSLVKSPTMKEIIMITIRVRRFKYVSVSQILHFGLDIN